eukprot:gnl/MRDRNA2_/MRDRNA2_98879_c0_seq1.p1 gnl/MRDRNA2_/MRDRNA2_98879_c0~~gnl/MRDRNA2_/MRDRNA2_98879_c0_seq1.p1  ORF type:complete len:376 (+),score=118.92 gnl/MRDRNA2_/MRDRNA2_98879_c0_seq1:146-1273(+)
MILQFAPVLVALRLVCVYSVDVDGDFDSQVASANSELNDIVQDVETSPSTVAAAAAAPEAVTSSSTNLDTTITKMQEEPEAELQMPLASGAASLDFSSSNEPLPQQMSKLQKNMKSGRLVTAKLRSAITQRSSYLQEAKDLLHRELNVLEQETLLKLREISKVKKLQANVGRMHEQAAEEDKILEASRKKNMMAQSGAETAEALDGSASHDLEWAKQKAAAAHERLLHSQGAWQNQHQTSLAKIARLTNVIDSMKKEQTGEQSQGDKFASQCQILMSQMQEIQTQVAAAATAKQNADINVAQVIHKWKETLKQLREQVAINTQYSQIAKGGGDVQKQIDDLMQQVKERDTQIADLQEQVDEKSMGADQGLRGVSR